MAGKTLSGFEISKGEPLTIGEEACARDLKRVISMIDEHLTEEKFTNSYTRKRKISKSAASLMALDLELSGVNGAADAEAGASSLKAKLQAIRGAVTAHDDLDTDDDEPEPKAVDWLSKPLERGALRSVLLLPLPADADVAIHKDAVDVLKAEYGQSTAASGADCNAMLKAWIAVAPDGAAKQAAEAATDGAAGPMRKAWRVVLLAAIRRALAAAKKRGQGAKKRKQKAADGPASAGGGAMSRKALATARLNGEVLEAQHKAIQNLTDVDHDLLAKRRKMKAELARIREKQENGGFEQFAYRKPGNETMKPELLARWQAAQANLYELELATEENASLRGQGLLKTLMERAKREMHLCDVEAHRGAAFLRKLREKQRNSKELKGLARDDEEGKNIEKLGAEIEAEEKKKLAETESQRAMAAQVAALTAAVKQAVGTKRPRGGTQPTAANPAPDPGRKKKRRGSRAKKPGQKGYAGCNGVFVASGKRCGGDHWVSEHYKEPQKYGGEIKPAPPKSTTGGKGR